jgi:hypothetical protein
MIENIKHTLPKTLNRSKWELLKLPLNNKPREIRTQKGGCEMHLHKISIETRDGRKFMVTTYYHWHNEGETRRTDFEETISNPFKRR